MDTMWNVLTWGVSWSRLKAASLYVMGNLGLNTPVDAVDVLGSRHYGKSSCWINYQSH